MVNPQEVTFAAALGAAAGILLASFLHIPYLEFPLLVMGAIAGAALAWTGMDIIGGDVF